ncbi:trypsin-like serine protease [Nakamurella sp. A5-74]|uniref:Trypsin-like serine protease n=1 Tax=Nakamurella sp. A5-74 TaxID=3158264 RepID=A0AAU8DV13_9ACTN
MALVNHSAPQDDLFSGQFCGAVAVRPEFAITASHCVDHRSASSIDVVLGADDICRTTDGGPVPGIRIRVAEILPHAPGASSSDLSLLRLAVPVSPYSIASTLTEASDNPPQRGTAAGWGHSAISYAYSCTLKRFDLQQDAPKNCEDGLERSTALQASLQISPDIPQWCAIARPGSDNTCVGDSGGPVYTTDADPRVFAVVDWGVGCGPRDPGYYSFLPDIDTWIALSRN